MVRNTDLVCYYCGHVPICNTVVAIIGWGTRAMQLTESGCHRCGIGAYIPDHGRVVCLVMA